MYIIYFNDNIYITYIMLQVGAGCEDWGPFGNTAVVYLVLCNVTGWSWECLEDWGLLGKSAVVYLVLYM